MKTEEILTILYNIARKYKLVEALEFANECEEFFIKNNIIFIKNINDPREVIFVINKKIYLRDLFVFNSIESSHYFYKIAKE